jgi:4-amino-4-deoxy-L-arabinose transferase-like glycosyltransferase
VSFRSDQPVSARSLFIALLVVGLLCRVAFVWFTPAFYAPDEQSHYHYIQYLAEHHALPVLNSKLGDASNEWEYSQPPFYYALLVPAFSAAQAVFHQPAAIVLVLRAFSILLWLLNVWFGVVLLRRLRIEDELTRVLVFGLVCLLPTYTFVSAAINNDNLLATLGGAVLGLMAQRQPSWKTSLALGLTLGLALLTKQSAVVFFPAVALLALLDASRQRLPWRTAIRHLAVALGLATLMYLPWALRNWRLYATLTPEYLATDRLPWPSFLYGVASAVHNLAKTFWSVSGLSNDVGYPFPLLGFGALGLWWVGQQTLVPPERAVDATNWKRNGPLLGAFLLALGFNLLLVLRFGYLFGMGQGRHLFPLLFPVALVLAAGWRKLPVKALGLWATGFWVIYAVSFTLFSLSRFPR